MRREEDEGPAVVHVVHSEQFDLVGVNCEGMRGPRGEERVQRENAVRVLRAVVHRNLRIRNTNENERKDASRSTLPEEVPIILACNRFRSRESAPFPPP